MSKKMKRVAFDSSPHVSYEDDMARFKHQTLLHECLELQQETDDARSNLMALNKKKQTLEAEVRFLRQRHKFLLNNKSQILHGKVFAKPLPTQVRKTKEEKARFKKQTTLHKLPPTDKKKAARSMPSPEYDLNHGTSLHSVKQLIHRGVANQRVRINGPKVSPFQDSRQKGDACRGQEPMGQTRKPVIDLNQISREEEELQELWRPSDPPTLGFIRNAVDEPPSDVSLPVYRKVLTGSGSGSGSSGRSGKRKISWQDPVALRV